LEETGYELSTPGEVESLKSFMQIPPKSSALQGIRVTLEDTRIIANPFLNDDCHECCPKTEDEAQEPENIYYDIS
jgi:hypothetical protein